MNYNELNVHPRDSRVTFNEEEHLYLVDGCGGYDSVTAVVKDCFEQFDADYWASRKSSTPEQALALKQKWEENGRLAREAGTLLHERIERHYLGYEPEPEALQDRAFAHFLSFARSFPLKPFRSEWRLFSTKYSLAGTLDFLAFDGREYVIFDWKRSCKLVDPAGAPVTENRWGTTGLGLMRHIPDTSYWHYALQLSLYRRLLEEEYGIHAAKSYLGAFHPDNPRPYILEMPYLEREVLALLNSRLKE